jgi:hypothetical protein
VSFGGSVAARAPDEAADKAVTVRAVATVAGSEMVRELGTLGDIQLADKPKFTVEILPGADASVVKQVPGEPLEFTIRPGQTISLKAKAVRHDFEHGIGFGGDGQADRNLPHGVFIDNVGLSGLLIVEGQDEREFFITAAPIAKPCRRLFHLRTTADGNQASVPAVMTSSDGVDGENDGSSAFSRSRPLKRFSNSARAWLAASDE